MTFFCFAKRKSPKKRRPLLCRPAASLRCSPPGAEPQLALASRTQRGSLRCSDTRPLVSPRGCASRRHRRGPSGCTIEFVLQQLTLLRSVDRPWLPLLSRRIETYGREKSGTLFELRSGSRFVRPARASWWSARPRVLTREPEGDEEGWPSFWLLFLGHARKSNSPTGEKHAGKSLLTHTPRAASTINRFISETAFCHPTNKACATIAWPIFSSFIPGNAAIAWTL